MALKYNDTEPDRMPIKPGLSDSFWFLVPLALILGVVAWLVIIFLCLSPANAQTLLLEDNFNGSISPAWKQLPESQPAGFTHYKPSTDKEVFVPTPAFEGSGSVRYYALQGTNEHTAWQIGFNTLALLGKESVDELCMEWREYFEPTYPFPTGSQKLLRCGFYTDNQPASHKELGVLLQTSNSDLNMQLFCGRWGDSSLCNVDRAWYSNHGIETGQWVTLKLYFKLNTPGARDGVLRLYKNGYLYLESFGVDFRGIDPLGYNYCWLGGNSSNKNGELLTKSGSRFIDAVKVWDKCASGGGSTTSTTVTVTTTRTTTLRTTSTRTTSTTLSQCQKDISNAQKHCR